jgi:hypothetical protein
VAPNVTGGLTATDACGVANITQNPAAGAALTGLNLGNTSIVVTVTDVNGNARTCSVVVSVLDNSGPSYINCPTTMVMIGNDPDQCSGKVNWSIPVAVDDCEVISNVQISGPAPGTAVQVTCPPTPQTIVYRATDRSGNTSTCSFQVVVMDTQKPQFDADITMPGDITVSCDQVPTNCVFHGNGLCTPLSQSDVNDNCPGNLVITFNEVSTQNPNNAVCGHYSYTITRTWTVTDCAGNSRQHTQVITVRDVTAPQAVCKPVTAILNDFGVVVVTPALLNNGSSDNCAVPGVMTYAISRDSFDCGDLGDNVVTLTVTDPCGNAASCTSVVTIQEGAVKCNPQYDVMGSDPCTCLNNATSQSDGQFGEFLQVQSIGGQTWRVIFNTGFFDTNSPTPPAAPILVPIGKVMDLGTADGVDNDGDGAVDEPDEVKYYSLEGAPRGWYRFHYPC